MFADVILPLPLAEATFTYLVPEDIRPSISRGDRVIVPFGPRKFYTGIVSRLHPDPPRRFKTKEIHSLIDPNPVVTHEQLSLWEWMSFYYMASLGDVCNAALPSALKMESQTTISLNAAFSGWDTLSHMETKIIGFLRHKPSTKMDILNKALGVNNVLPHIHSLMLKNAVTVDETIHQKFISKTEKIIRVNPKMSKIKIASLIGKSEKQRELFDYLSTVSSKKGIQWVGRKELLRETKAAPAVINGLIAKNVLEQSVSVVSRINATDTLQRPPYPLSPSQNEAFHSVKECFEEKRVCLLHGVTSSGKTEIYIHLITEILREGRQVLYLVPEIALTTQLTRRLREVFGSKLGVYHSQVNDNERTEIWRKMLSTDSYDIVIGVRSSLFLPFDRLGLVIVDEEHETSYKQQDMPPRYHARDTAIVLAQLSEAKVLLGSATPSFESYYNAQTGKYGLVTLSKRFEEIELPEIRLENTRELRRTKKMKSIFAPLLTEHIQRALSCDEQVILFRNRRGYAAMLECKSCGWIPKCRRCDVALTYHKVRNGLKCHYCNATYEIPSECPVCHDSHIEIVGQGTEQIEEEAKKLFPGATAARMDGDTTHGKSSYERILSDFENRRTQILIGTQMLAKGLDFENVSVVGIISADSMLNHPDFRSYERAFQMMLQTSGRAGRKNKRGTVVIQTSDPSQAIYDFVKKNDYHGFFLTQMDERRTFRYPPFSRLISITLRHKSEEAVDDAAETLFRLLHASLGESVLGPSKPVVAKIRTYHFRKILLKIEVGQPAKLIREIILKAEHEAKGNPSMKNVRIEYVVDTL